MFNHIDGAVHDQRHPCFSLTTINEFAPLRSQSWRLFFSFCSTGICLAPINHERRNTGGITRSHWSSSASGDSSHASAISNSKDLMAALCGACQSLVFGGSRCSCRRGSITSFRPQSWSLLPVSHNLFRKTS